ncbi:MAG: BrnA antitoxin family protein [Deltaproteobacteria bacterium]|nr:BrnA antitoxin family protein [Deltaproteobacteria bacterium]
MNPTATAALPQAKVCIRLDQDILEWFKSQGKGYQTKINAVLRAFKEAQSG